MATWQYSIRIIDRNKFSKSSKTHFDWEDDNGEYDWSDSHIDKKALISTFSKILKPSKGWSTDIAQFGDPESHCIEIFFEDGKPLEISARLDLRSLDKCLLEKLLNAVKAIDGFIWVFHDGKILPPDISLLVSSIKSSPANKFLSSPLIFLENLNADQK